MSSKEQSLITLRDPNEKGSFPGKQSQRYWILRCNMSYGTLQVTVIDSSSSFNFEGSDIVIYPFLSKAFLS